MNTRRREKGQAVMLYAVLVPLTVLFALGIIDYMATTARMMAAVAAADLAAHAGAQVVNVLPDGRIVSNVSAAQQTAASVFNAQKPVGSVLNYTHCGMQAARPTCSLQVSVRSAGFLLPARWVLVDAVGSLAYGATRDDQ